MFARNAAAVRGVRGARLALAWAALVLLPVAAQQTPKKEDSDGTLEIATKKIRAEELAREFVRDPQRARKAYITTPKEVKRGKMTGIPLLNPIYGEVEKVQGKDVYLKSGTPKVRVLLRAKTVAADLGAGAKVVSATGFVRDFRDGIITVEVHRVVPMAPGKEPPKGR